jgi:hypothetical protein
LSCDEFVLAMFLCDQAIQGKTIPAVLPPELVPPSFRKPASRHESEGGSRNESVSSQGTPSHMGDLDAMAGLPQSEYHRIFLQLNFDINLYQEEI